MGNETTEKVEGTSPSPVAKVSLVKQLQPTEPSLPLKSAFPRQSLGDSGTRLLHGIIVEEYNPNLQGIQGIRIYDEMRKSDGTVRAAMLACTLPIRRSQWFVNPATDADDPDNELNKEIANFVSHAIFDWLDLTWDDVLRQALLMVPFGVMLFEKVYGIKEHDGKKWVTLEKLAPRLPKSILQWELVDQTFGIQQIRQDGVLAQIPGSKLLTFVNEREGDNWWGTSMLRAAYKHWYFKNNFYKIDAIAFERQGLGVPLIKMPQGYSPDDEKAAMTSLQNLRANEQGFLLLPPGYEAEFMDMGAKTTRDPTNSINHHNKEILQSVLAQFLELGQNKTGSGSKALSQDHSDLFLKAMETIANNVSGVFNKDLIKELVDLNFNDVKVYPVLDYSGISKVDLQALSVGYAALVTAGAITPTDDDQQYLRAAMGLPPRTQEQIDADSDNEPTEEAQDDHMDIDDDNETTKPADVPANTDTQKDAKVDKAIDEKKPKPGEKKASDRRFSNGKGFTPWRPFTFAEKKVNWSDVQSTMDEMQATFSKEAIDLLNNAKDKFMTKLHVALANNDAKSVSSLEVTFIAEYTALIKDAMKSAYVYGKNSVSQELGVQEPANTAESMAGIAALASTVASKAAADIETVAKLSAVNALKQDLNALQAAGSIDSAIEEAIEKSVNNTAAVIIGQAINNGRNDVFERNTDDLYALQRSELLDDKTCNFCLSIDARVIEPDDEWANVDIFHSNCRGIWVGILNDEKNPPEITGIPDEVGDFYGGEVNSLVQPVKPITKPGGLAEKEVKRQEAKKSGKK